MPKKNFGISNTTQLLTQKTMTLRRRKRNSVKEKLSCGVKEKVSKWNIGAHRVNLKRTSSINTLTTPLEQKRRKLKHNFFNLRQNLLKLSLLLHLLPLAPPPPRPPPPPPPPHRHQKTNGSGVIQKITISTLLLQHTHLCGVGSRYTTTMGGGQTLFFSFGTASALPTTFMTRTPSVCGCATSLTLSANRFSKT
jgi:hypothetical protein